MAWLFPILLQILLSVTPLDAQDEPGDRGIPGEALLERRQDVAAVEIRSPDPATQMRALDTLAQTVGQGDASFRAETEAILSYILLPPRGEESPARGATFPQVRIRAARLAGELDSPGAAQVLLALLTEERDPAVLAAAVTSLSSMRHTDPHALAATFGRLLNRENSSGRRDSRLAGSLIRAAGRLYREWGADDPLLVRAILDARELPYSRETRQAAEGFVRLVLEG